MVLIISVFVAFGASGLAGASEQPHPQVRVFLDGKPMAFDVPPVMVNDRVMVPMRKIFETFGMKVTWNDETQTVKAERGSRFIELQIGNPTPRFNGRSEPWLDTPAVVRDGRTMVSLRFVAWSLGLNVDWDQEAHAVVISTQGSDHEGHH